LPTVLVQGAKQNKTQKIVDTGEAKETGWLFFVSRVGRAGFFGTAATSFVPVVVNPLPLISV